MRSILIALLAISVVVAGYFFSMQLQKVFGSIVFKINTKLGRFSKNKEYALQRYAFLHRSSPITRFYNWLNAQLIATGFKRSGVTPVGYVIYWFAVSMVLSLVLKLIIGISLAGTAFFTLALFIVCLVMTRVLVAEKMEHREAEVMDAIDLIIPEIGNGVKNAITLYMDNFAPSIRPEFKAFVSNIQDRGYSFEDAMFILADSLGTIFRDFAQKAVFYEKLGEPDMVDIFTDILETNRNRRQLRYENNLKFAENKMSFILSSFITLGYFVFLLFTDDFSRYFFLESGAGRFLLIVIMGVIIGVLAYITTIKSRTL